MTVLKKVSIALLAANFTLGFSHCIPLNADEPKQVFPLEAPPKWTASIVRSVRTQVESHHVLRPIFNDEISSRGFETFLLRIDPTKCFFFERDIDDFSSYKTLLDDQIREDSIEFAYVVYKRFLARLDEMLPTIHRQIDSQQDFELEESVSRSSAKIGYARDPKDMVERWRKSIKLEILTLRRDGKSDLEVKDILHQRYRQFHLQATRLSSDELLERYLSSLTNALDPHTNYKAPQAQERFTNELKLETSGIGAALKQIDGKTIVNTLVPGGAAEIDGRLKIGDRILAVAESDGELPIEIQDLSLNEVVKLIRGKTGTRVRLRIMTGTNDETQTYEMERTLVRLEDAAAKFEIVEEGGKTDGTPYKFGYIKLNSFYQDSEGAKANKENYRSATRDLRAILNRLSEAAVDGAILDLSTNDRGALSEAVSATGLFIDQGPVAQVKSHDGTFKTLADEESGVAWNGPLIVKISQASTSATEVFAGAIQDYARGLIVGDPKSHGKGTVQRIVDIVPDSRGPEQGQPYGALKLTVQQFYLPGGKSTQLIGVASDVVLPSMIAKLDISEGDLPYALHSSSGPVLQHQNYGMVDSAIKVELQKAVDARIAQDEAFMRQQRDIVAYSKQKSVESISLNETKFRASRFELDSEQIRNAFLDSNSEPGRIYIDHFYNREVLRAACDYVESLARNQHIAPK